MPRRFTNDGSPNDAVKLAAQGFTSWTFGTLAAVWWPDDTTAAYNLLVVGTDAQDFVELYTADTASGAGGAPRLWNGATASAASTPAITTDRWWLMVLTKATGTAQVRRHIYDWTANTWTRVDTGTLANASGTGATEHGIGFAAFPANSPNGHVAAVAAWQGYAMSDGEVDRLPSGLWDRWNPDLLIEFPSGRDHLTRTSVDCSKNRMRQTSSGSQVTRTNIAGPPGFRYSALNRRR